MVDKRSEDDDIRNDGKNHDGDSWVPGYDRGGVHVRGFWRKNRARKSASFKDGGRSVPVSGRLSKKTDAGKARLDYRSDFRSQGISYTFSDGHLHLDPGGYRVISEPSDAIISEFRRASDVIEDSIRGVAFGDGYARIGNGKYAKFIVSSSKFKKLVNDHGSNGVGSSSAMLVSEPDGQVLKFDPSEPLQSSAVNDADNEDGSKLSPEDVRSIMDRLDDADVRTREGLASDETIDFRDPKISGLPSALSTDGVDMVRAGLAARTAGDLPDDVVTRLAVDQVPEVRSAIYRNKTVRIDPKIVHYGAQDLDASVRLAVVDRPELSKDDLNALLGDRDWSVRHAAKNKVRGI
jgi:hypothetical protein